VEPEVSVSLRERTIVVTGAADGIGNATALGLAAEGARLVLAYFDAEGLGKLQSAFGDAARATFVQADVRQSDACERLARQAIATWGRVDAVVNCAGVVIPGAIDTTSAADIACQLDTNLGGTINVTRAFVPHFKRQGSGHLVLIASLAGTVPLPGESIYAASKFAVRGFAHSIAYELDGTGVQVTVVCPDSTRTRMLEIEAGDGGSSLSFASAPMEPAVVARAIVAALKRPRLEVTVPGLRGRLIRSLGAVPMMFGWLYPIIDSMGRRRKALFKRELETRRSHRFLGGRSS
jgi:short-subunit dehydrogenase